MVNVNKLKGKIVECEMTPEKLASAIGIDTSTIYRKLSIGGESFTVGEADRIANTLKLSCNEAMAIFFSQYVA